MGNKQEVPQKPLDSEAEKSPKSKRASLPTPQLIKACNRKDYKFVKEYQEDVNVRDKNGATPLIAACEQEDLELVTQLLKKGAEVDSQEDDGWTSLMRASRDGHVDIVKTLIEHKASVNLSDKTNCTPLMVASTQGCNNVLKILLENDARGSINEIDLEGKTALHRACFGGRIECVQTLLKYGADTTIKSKKYETPYDIAKRMGNIDLCKILQPPITKTESESEHTKNKSSLVAVTITCSSTSTQNAPIRLDSSFKKLSLPPLAKRNPSPDLSADKDFQNEGSAYSSQPSTPFTPLSPLSPITPKPDVLSVSPYSTAATPDEIAISTGIDPEQLDEPFTNKSDLAFQIAKEIPNWVQYATPLGLTQQEINSIKTDPHLTYSMKTRELLEKWYGKNAHTKKCHYRVLVETCCKLGQAQVAGNICKLLKGVKAASFPQTSATEVISEDLIIFKEEVVGSGALGIVFKGEYKKTPCAVKLLRHLAMEVQLSIPAANLTSSNLVRRYDHECTLLKELDHPNIVKYLTITNHPQHPEYQILVLELLDYNLRQFFSQPLNRELSQQTQKKLCLDIASALAYIHSHRIVHADLCSDNILLNCKDLIPVAKVCDFGMSKIMEGEDKSASLLLLGRKGFLPPEAGDINFKRYDSSFDIFSFGAIMVQIVRGLQTIHSQSERNSQLKLIATDHPLLPLIERCLLDQKEFRPSASELQLELTDLTV